MDGQKSSKIAIIALSICLIASITASLLLLRGAGATKPPFKTAKAYAVTLVNNELYAQAFDQLDFIQKNYKLSDNEAASILHQMGEIAAERLRDPRLALSAYFKLKEYYPNHPLAGQVDRQIVAQLDKIGNRGQAQRMLEKSVSLGQPASEVEPSKIVAKIGDRVVSSDEINDAISNLPPSIASQFSSPQAKLQFARSYIGQQLMFEAALRGGYDKRPQVLERMEVAQREVLANEYFKDNVANRVDISSSDIEIYYEMHKNQFGGEPLDKVRGEVAEAARLEKMAQLQSKLLDELLDKQNIKFYPENL